jgi:hypothetical protein
LFLVIRAMNELTKREEARPKPAEPSLELKILTTTFSLENNQDGDARLNWRWALLLCVSLLLARDRSHRHPPRRQAPAAPAARGVGGL